MFCFSGSVGRLNISDPLSVGFVTTISAGFITKARCVIHFQDVYMFGVILSVKFYKPYTFT